MPDLPDSPLRLAFIGGHGHHYLAGALKDADVRVEAATVAPDRHDAARTRERFAGPLDAGTARWFHDAAEMLEAFRPDAVSVGGVYAHNSDLILEGLRRGIPVVADKPVAASWDALTKLREAAREPGRVLLTEFDFRARSAFRSARRAVAEGRLGRVALATAQKSYRFGDRRPDFYRRRADYGSTMLWIASHGIDAVAFATGLRFRRVAGAHGNVTRPDYGEMEDHCAAVLTLENGATALVHADLLRPRAAPTHGDDRLRIAGSEGVLEVRNGRCRLTTHREGERDITDEEPGEPTHRALLGAIFSDDRRFYSTEMSLEIASALLAARDAADGQTFVDVPREWNTGL